MDHGFAQILGCGLTCSLAGGNIVSGAIVLHNHRVIHGHDLRSLLEIPDWIAALLHDFADELVRFQDGGRRVVYKMPLDLVPADGIRLLRLAGKRANLKRLARLPAKFQDTLGAMHAFFLPQDAIVFRPETSAQNLAPAAAGKGIGDKSGNDNDSYEDQNEDQRMVHPMHLLGREDRCESPAGQLDSTARIY